MSERWSLDGASCPACQRQQAEAMAQELHRAILIEKARARAKAWGEGQDRYAALYARGFDEPASR